MNRRSFERQTRRPKSPANAVEAIENRLFLSAVNVVIDDGTAGYADGAATAARWSPPPAPRAPPPP